MSDWKDTAIKILKWIAAAATVIASFLAGTAF